MPFCLRVLFMSALSGKKLKAFCFTLAFCVLLVVLSDSTSKLSSGAWYLFISVTTFPLVGNHKVSRFLAASFFSFHWAFIFSRQWSDKQCSAILCILSQGRPPGPKLQKGTIYFRPPDLKLIAFDGPCSWNILCELPCNSHKMFQQFKNSANETVGVVITTLLSLGSHTFVGTTKCKKV